jgi:hypothetical protein
MFVLCMAASAGAAPFAAVVPKEIQVDTTDPTYKVVFNYWGWIVCTGDSLTQSDLDMAVIETETDKGGATVSQRFDNTDTLAPLRAGEAAGQRVDPNNAVMDTLLQAGETLKAPMLGFFHTEIVFNAGSTDTLQFTSTITMAGEELTYTTTMIFGELGTVLPVVIEGQRIASTPVPVAVQAATWGNLKTRFLPGSRER